MSKEIDPYSVALFQEGKLVAFGHIKEYSETEDAFNTNVVIEKGQLRTGEHTMQIVREYLIDPCSLDCLKS